MYERQMYILSVCMYLCIGSTVAQLVKNWQWSMKIPGSSQLLVSLDTDP